MSKTISFTITLPEPAVKLIVALIPGGLHGSKRAEVAKNLILDQLKLLRSQGLEEAATTDDVGDEG